MLIFSLGLRNNSNFKYIICHLLCEILSIEYETETSVITSPPNCCNTIINILTYVVLTHRGPSECLLFSLRRPLLVCHILFPGQTPRMIALSPRQIEQNKKVNTVRNKEVSYKTSNTNKRKKTDRELLRGLLSLPAGMVSCISTLTISSN